MCLKRPLGFLMEQEHTKDLVHLLPQAVVTMNCRTEFPNWLYAPQIFPRGASCVAFQDPFPGDYKSPVGDCLERKQDPANLAGANPKYVNVS